MLNINEISFHIKTLLEKFNLRHEMHSFDSSARMIDIWIGDKFYCIQIEENLKGISLVTAETDFSTIPDQSFQYFDDFKYELERILLPG
jgi:hypothetical protein